MFDNKLRQKWGIRVNHIIGFDGKRSVKVMGISGYERDILVSMRSMNRELGRIANALEKLVSAKGATISVTDGVDGPVAMNKALNNYNLGYDLAKEDNV